MKYYTKKCLYFECPKTFKTQLPNVEYCSRKCAIADRKAYEEAKEDLPNFDGYMEGYDNYMRSMNLSQEELDKTWWKDPNEPK